MRWWQLKKRHADLERELRFDLELEEEERRERGLSSDEAHYAAKRAFGNPTLIKEQTHEVWGLAPFEQLWQDLRYALRQMRRSPGYFAVCLITLCLGIGANAAVFSVIQAVILRPLPYHDPSRLMHVTDPQDPQDGGILYKDFESLKQQCRSFADLAVYYRDSGWSRVTLTGAHEPEVAQGAYVSANFFPVLGEAPLLGRVFTSEEEWQGERVIVLSYGLWRRRFGGSPDVLEQRMRVGGESLQVIGVMPETFQMPASDSEFWAPITTNHYWADPAANANDGRHSRGFYARWQAIGRLKPDVTAQQAQSELDTIFRRLESADPDPNRGIGIAVVPLHIEVNGRTRLALYVLFASVCLLLLIACTNVANLLLARGLSRAHEMALRTALGASRGRILRQSFTEIVFLAALSGLLSLPVAYLGIHTLIALGPQDIPRLQETGLNLGVLGFTFSVVLVCTAVLAFVLAVRSWRADPAEEMKSRSMASSASGGLTGLRKVLIVTEVALSVILLTSAGLLIHSFLIVKAVDPGMDAEHALTANISLSGGSSGWPSSIFESILARLQAVPGVKDTGAIDSLFDLSPTGNLGLRSIEGRSPEPHEQWTALTWDTVRGDYFQAIGSQLLRGRYFSEEDGPHSPLVAVIDERAARRYWPGENAVGKRFKGQDRRGGNDDWLTVIGVVRDIRTHGLEREPTPHIYEWYRQSGNATPDLVVRVAGNSAGISSTIRRTIRSVAPAAILSNITTVDQQLSQQLAPRRFQTSLLGIFSLLALLLASVGIYGLMHYSVSLRTREIGVRMALGAQPSSVYRLVTGQAGWLTAVGLAIGLPCSMGTSMLMRRLLFGIQIWDMTTLGGVTLLLAVASMAASFLPARRAASLDPIQALRSE